MRPSKKAREAVELLDQAQPEKKWRMRPAASGAVLIIGDRGAVCKILRDDEGRATAHLLLRAPMLIEALVRENERLRAKLAKAGAA